MADENEIKTNEPGESLKKLKNSLEKIVQSMKQPDEELTEPAPQEKVELPVKDIFEEIEEKTPPKQEEKQPSVFPIQQHQPAPPPEKDLREGESLPIRYRCDNQKPFVVMAGKFTKTVREEYELLRQEYADAAVPKPVLKVLRSDKKPEPPVPQKPKVEQTIVVPPEEPPVQEKKNPKAQKTKKTKKTKKPFSFRDFIWGEEGGSKKNKKLLDDYNDERDAEDIRTEIEGNLHGILVRTVVLFVTTLLSVTAAVIAQFTPLFSEAMRTGWLFYGIILFSLFTISVLVARLPIVNGLMPLRSFKGNADTPAAVTALAVGMQAVTSLCTPHVFTNGTYHIYVPIAITALLMNSMGKLLIILRTLDNFRFLSSPSARYAGKIYTDMKNAEKMVSEFPSKVNIIGYVKRSRLMSNFLRLSYAPDPSEEMAGKTAPFMAVIAVLFGVIYGIMAKDFAGGVTSFALTACVGTPMVGLIALNIPMKKLCRNALNGDAMISGYEAVQQFGDTNAIMIDVSQLYPAGTVTLSGVKIFRQSKLNEALMAGAAIMYAVNGTMSYIFENMVRCPREKLPKVESVVYEDEKGLMAWVSKQRVLLGSRALMQAHNIKIPKKELEDKYTKNGNAVTYISVSGELIAMFVLSYRTDREIAVSLRELEENGVSFIVRTIDPHVTKEKIAQKFGLFHRCITVLPTGLGNLCHEVMGSVDESARAYVVTKGRISSFARAVSGCIKMKSNTGLSKILQYLGIGTGIVLSGLISFVSGFQKLGSVEILGFILFWGVAAVAASLIKK